MQYWLGVQAPGRVILCTSLEERTSIKKYGSSEIAEFLQAVFQFPPDIAVATATWQGTTTCNMDPTTLSMETLSVRMKPTEVEQVLGASPTGVEHVHGSRPIAHGTNMHAVYTAVKKTDKKLLPKLQREKNNVEFLMGAQQQIRDEWNDQFLSVVPVTETPDQWYATPFYWAHAVAHIWTLPRTASSFGVLPMSQEYGLDGPPKWATLDGKNDGNWRPVYATDDQIPVIAVGDCVGKSTKKKTKQSPRWN